MAWHSSRAPLDDIELARPPGRAANRPPRQAGVRTTGWHVYPERSSADAQPKPPQGLTSARIFVETFGICDARETKCVAGTVVRIDRSDFRLRPPPASPAADGASAAGA